jgi:uncharacterized membrane protein
MDKQPHVVESLIGNSTEYVETRLNLFKLKLVDKTSDIASSVVSILPLLLIFVLVFILLNIGLALLIGDLVGRASWGFLILTAVYLIAGFVLYKSRDKLIKVPFANLLIRKFLKGTNV